MKLDGRKQKYVLIGGLALLLAGVVYWNCQLNAGPEAGENGDTQQGGETLQIESMSGETQENANAGEDYFETFRTERENMRDMEIDYLDEIIATSASDVETLADAQAQKLALVNNMEKEFTIESLIRAKGFRDAAVTFHGGSVNVVVDCETLTDEQVAQILDIVQRETGESAENVKVIPGAQ